MDTKTQEPTKTPISTFFTEQPHEKRIKYWKDNDKLQIYDWGEEFESIFAEGSLQKIKPFVGMVQSDDSSWTEVGLGCVTESGRSLFWSLYDGGEGKKSYEYNNSIKAMAVLGTVKLIDSATLAHCYYVATGKMKLAEDFTTFLEQKDGQWINVENRYPTPYKQGGTKNQKKKFWLIFLLIAISVLVIIFWHRIF